MFAKMAFLNLWRRKSRTLIVIAMIGICLAGLMFMQGIYDGWLDEIIENTIKSDGGEIVVQKQGYRLSQRLDDRIEDPEKVLALVAAQPDVKRAARRIIIDGIAATGRSSQGAMIIGVESHEFSDGHLNGYITQGRPFEQGKIPEAVITAEFAEKLKTGLGKKLVITAQGLDKDIASIAVRIAGIIRTYNMYLDKNSVFIDYNVADHAFRMAGGASQITAELADPGSVKETVVRLEKALGRDREVLDWRMRYKALDYSVSAMAVFNLIHYSLVFVVVAMGITDIILISVLERVREFGIMMALGTKFGTVRRIILMESAILGSLGLGLGVILGMAVLVYYHEAGIDLSAFSEGLEYYSLPPVMYADIRPQYLLYGFISVSIASAASALAPIWMLWKKKPVQSITMG